MLLPLWMADIITPMGMKLRCIRIEKCTDIVHELGGLGSINLDDKNWPV